MIGYISMRPHHLLCLPGYKGYGYDKQHKNSWDEVYERLQEKPDTWVKIVSGKDSLCKTCPNDGSNGSTCNSKRLSILDNKVKDLLNIKENFFYKYSFLSNKVKETITPEIHKELCGECQWRAFGLCNDTFVKTNLNKNIAPIPRDFGDTFTKAS